MDPAPVHPSTTAERSVWKNFSDAIFAPGETFLDVGRRPRVLVPLLLLLAAVLIVSWFHMPVWSELQAIKMAANKTAASGPPSSKPAAAKRTAGVKK